MMAVKITGVYYVICSNRAKEYKTTFSQGYKIWIRVCSGGVSGKHVSITPNKRSSDWDLVWEIHTKITRINLSTWEWIEYLDLPLIN